MTNVGISETDLYSCNMALINGSLTVVQSGAAGNVYEIVMGARRSKDLEEWNAFT